LDNLRLLLPTYVDFEFPFLFVIDPFAHILVAVFKCLGSLSIHLILCPFALIYLTILIVILTLSIHLSIDP